MAKRSPGADFLEHHLPHAVSSSLAKRMKDRKAAHGAPKPEEDGEIEDHHEAPQEEAVEEQEEGAGLNASEDAESYSRPVMPREGGGVPTTDARARSEHSGGNLHQHPDFPEEKAKKKLGHWKGMK